MSVTKYGKYVITELKPKNEAPWTPVFKPEELTPVLFLDSSVLEGAFYVETAWLWPPFAENQAHGDAHKHDYDEVLAFFGTDPRNSQELHAEIEVPLEDEIHYVTRSVILFIPKGLTHGPIKFKRMDKPLFHFACGTGKLYY